MNYEPSKEERKNWDSHYVKGTPVVVHTDVYSNKPLMKEFASKTAKSTHSWRDAGHVEFDIAWKLVHICAPTCIVRLSSRLGLPAFEVVDGEEVSAVVRFGRTKMA